MAQIDYITAVQKLKKLTFSKSWQNSFVTNKKRLLNLETSQFEDKELDLFVFLPATYLTKQYASDSDFLEFRSDNKHDKDWDYKLISDATENNNRRLAIWYASQFLEALDIKFTIDDSYTLYIDDAELRKLEKSEIPEIKDFYNFLYIPTGNIARKHGVQETWN